MPVKLRVNVQTRFLTSDTQLLQRPRGDSRDRSRARRTKSCCSARTSTRGTRRPGATDNADGSAAAMEAMRILKAIGVQPRRTIRVALWGGEEQGLLGSRAHVRAHLPARRTPPPGTSWRCTSTSIPAWARSTAGTWRTTRRPRPLFDAWIEPLEGSRRAPQRRSGRSAAPTTSASAKPGCRASIRCRTTSLRRPHAPHQRRHLRTHQRGATSSRTRSSWRGSSTTRR